MFFMKSMCEQLINNRFRAAYLYCVIVILTSLCTLSSCTTDDVEYSFYASVSGHVVDAETGEPLSGVIVTINPGNNNVVTTENGFFEFKHLNAQQYTLLFQKDTYKPNRKNLSLATGEKADVIVALARIP